MSLHADALAVLTGWSAPDAGQEALRKRYADHLAAHPDGLARDCYPDHLTASTLVMSADGQRVLLTLHAKARQWFQFGGHCEPGDATLAAAATREAVEESGLLGLVLDPVPVQLSEHAVPFCDPRGGVHHLDVRFLAVAPLDADHEVSDESLDVRWWPAEALPDPQADMVDLVRLAQSRLAQNRLAQNRLAQDRLAQNRLAQNRLAPSRLQSTSDSPEGGSSLAPAE